MTAIGPVEYSGFTNQASDVGKVTGQDFQRIHQQQLAEVVRRQEQEKKDETKPIENSEDIRIVSDSEGKKQSSDQSGNSSKEEELEQKNIETYEEVKYDDPDLGRNLDWQS